jgi:hypothetical protein
MASMQSAMPRSSARRTAANPGVDAVDALAASQALFEESAAIGDAGAGSAREPDFYVVPSYAHDILDGEGIRSYNDHLCHGEYCSEM